MFEGKLLRVLTCKLSTPASYSGDIFWLMPPSTNPSSETYFMPVFISVYLEPLGIPQSMLMKPETNKMEM